MSTLKPKFQSALAAGLVALCLACAAGPPQPRSPEHIRKSVYYTNKAVQLFNKGCYAHALDYFQEAHQRYTAADNLEGVAHSLNSMADLYYRLDDMQSAVLVYNDAISVYQTLKDRPALARTLSNKAAALISLGKLDEAREVLDQADALDGDHSALRLKTRALLKIKQKEFQQAQSLLIEALAAADKTNNPIVSSIHYALGHVALMKNQPAQAREEFTKALDIDRNAAAYDDIARDLGALGTCYVLEENPVEAVNYFKRSAKIYALLKNRRKTDEMTAQLKQSAARSGQDIQATLHWITQWMEESKGADLCD